MTSARKPLARQARRAADSFSKLSNEQLASRPSLARKFTITDLHSCRGDRPSARIYVLSRPGSYIARVRFKHARVPRRGSQQRFSRGNRNPRGSDPAPLNSFLFRAQKRQLSSSHFTHREEILFPLSFEKLLSEQKFLAIFLAAETRDREALNVIQSIQAKYIKWPLRN